MKRGLGVVLVLLAVAAAAGVGWVAGQRVKSPAQVAFEAEPPPPSLITVEVELTELAADVITRADVGYDDPALLSLGGALGGLPNVLVVTAAPERASELGEGTPSIEISGRPVFLLTGEIPVYRDLRPQSTGPDVLQLEQALARLGFLTVEPDTEWDEATGAAVEAWYQAAGYEANGVTDEEQHRIDTARNQVEASEDRVRAAERAQTAAEEAITRAEDGRDDAREDVVRAGETLADAEEALAKAEEGPDELEVNRARSALASAQERLAFAHSDAETGAATAERAVTESERDREQAARDYTIAGARWESAQTGVHPDSGTIPDAVQMEALRLAVDRAGLDLEAAERAIGEARAARDRQEIEAGATIRSARDDLAAARRALEDLLAPPDTEAQARAVRDARSSLDSARSSVEYADADLENALSNLDDALADLEDARGDLVRAQQDLEEIEAETGVWIPAGELIFLERLPVRVDLLTAERGSVVSGAFMTVTGSELAVRGSVLVRDVSLVQEGGEALIDDPLLASPLTGTIRLVEDRPGTRDVAADRHYIEIVADGIPDDLVGKNVKVVIPVGGTEGEVLAVPAAALSATADGSTRVEVEQPDGSTRFVLVEPGLAASGLVEVTPLDGELREGDLVVVGVASGG